ncbi:MAG: Nramp family divalent metal transporter [Pyrinomonadaceae bacterium]
MNEKNIKGSQQSAGVGTPAEEYIEASPNRNLPPLPYKDMPEPLPLRKILGPSVILAGLGVGSGEYIIWPFISSTVGVAFLWAAVLGVTVQYFLNMEIERYTLATGETAVAGFVRFWKPWGGLFCLFTILPNVWPGWATSGVTIFTFLTGGGNVTVITIIVLVALGVALTVSPVVYQTLEKAQFFKVGLTIIFLIVAIFTAISASAWAELPQIITNFGQLPDSNLIPISLMLSGLVFAGAGGANNLVQSNWIRDKGFGMGIYIPKIVSPITGEEAAAPTTGSMIRQDKENIRRFWGWWKSANYEQLISFWFICIFSICIFSTLAYSTVFGKNLTKEANLSFIQAEGEALKGIVAPWFGTFFWIFGSLSLVLVALGVLDYVARLVADVLKTVYLQQNQRWTESRIYFLVVWGMIVVGSLILLSGFSQPLILLVISACLNGMVMFVYSILLIQLNRKALPEAIKVRGIRLGALGFAVLFYGFFAGWLIIAQLRSYFLGS